VQCCTGRYACACALLAGLLHTDHQPLQAVSCLIAAAAAAVTTTGTS
jgi:hypothetical protein